MLECLRQRWVNLSEQEPVNGRGPAAAERFVEVIILCDVGVSENGERAARDAP